MPFVPSILLVEDNPDDYEATVRSLRENRCMNPIRWCKNGRDALDLLGHAQPDEARPAELPAIILLDLNLPGIDGRDVLQAVKNDRLLRRIPVVILTTSSDERDIDRCYEIGASTYVQKPVSFAGLTAAIRTLRDYWFGLAILPGTGE